MLWKARTWCKATKVGERLEEFINGTCCRANSCITKGLVRWLPCLLARIDNFYSTNQVPTTLLTWEQTSNLKAINLEKTNNKASKYIQEKCIKNELNEEEVEVM